jgi:putative heme-binding domain-containing protein
MAKFGRGRMPHLGSELPDPSGLELIDGWIRDLGKPPTQEGKLPATAAGFEQAAGRIDTAFPFARALGRGYPDVADREKILAAAAKLEPGPVRDLFEGYLPPDPKGRKLGPNPRPSAILSLTGDAKRGEEVFFAKESKCADCHKVGDRGTPLGPDLTAIGKTRPKAELMEALLEPSRRIDPQYTSYLVKTADGRALTGLLVKRDDKQIILRDAQNKEVAVTADNLEGVQPSRVSLMPDGLLADFTPQQAADLLEFLSTRR